jgi:hypothetical protein
MAAPLAFLGMDYWWQWAALIVLIVLIIVYFQVRKRQ